MPDSSRASLRVPAVLGTEHLGRDFGADPSPVRSGERVVPRVPQRRRVVLDPLGNLDLERRRLRRVHLERHPQPRHSLEVPILQVRPFQPLPALFGQRVKTSTEQGPHLLRGDLIPNAQAVDAGHPGTHPAPRGLTLLGVVRRQRGAWSGGAVMRGYLPGQVRVPGPGRELVQAHRHTSLRVLGGPCGPRGEKPLPIRDRQCTGCAVDEHFGYRGRDVVPVQIARTRWAAAIGCCAMARGRSGQLIDVGTTGPSEAAGGSTSGPERMRRREWCSAGKRERSTRADETAPWLVK